MAITCKNCANCIKDDGTPYCVLKDLYTEVELNQVCDEVDIFGKKMFVKEVEDEQR